MILKPFVESIFDGYLLISDITGYTGYLSSSGLDHAQDILTHLLKLLVQHTRPPLIISHLAGDAVLSYGLDDHFLSSQVFIESIEDTYVAFRNVIHFKAKIESDLKASASPSETMLAQAARESLGIRIERVAGMILEGI